jgi:hypothetical protein
MTHHPAIVAYREAATALYLVERDIASRQNSTHLVDRKIMPSLEAKRERMLAALIPLKLAADAVPVRNQRVAPSSDIKFRAIEWVPIGCAVLLDPGPLPDFLRRST